MTVAISREVLEQIRRKTVDCAPKEACGLLFGEAGTITSWKAAENVADQPLTRFEIDPAVLFAALRAQRAGGAAILGYWHSHPSGDARPSRTDAAMAAPDGKLWLIVGGDEVLLWRATESGAVHGRFDQVEWTLGT